MAYRLKTVRYQNSDCKILLQNENGPCPLLAAANALLLKKEISLPSESIRSGVASIDDVVNVLAEKALLSTTKLVDSHTTHLNDLLEVFPKLQYGMDVNPKFTQGVTGVEYTSSLTAFDLLNVDLVHGWLLDPQDVDTIQQVQQKTYNELVELVVQGNEASQEVEKIAKEIDAVEAKLDKLAKSEGSDEEEEEWVEVEGSSETESQVKEEEDEVVAGKNATTSDGEEAVPTANDVKQEESTRASEETSNDAEAATVDTNSESKDDEPVLVNEEDVGKNQEDDTKTNAHAEPSSDEKKDDADEPTLSRQEYKQKLETQLTQLQEEREKLSTVATNASLINAFLNSTGHQLTHYGLHELYEYLQEDTLCVFFRNNHFATLTKHKGVLYLLVTDLGYANVPEIMWEKLDGIDGDTEYVSATFLKPAPRSDLNPAPGPTLDPKHVLAQRGQVDADMQLALQLSKHDVTAGTTSGATTNMDEEEGKLMAAATEASLRTFNGIEDTTEEASKKGGTFAILPSSTATNHTGNGGLVDGCSTQEDSDKLIAMQMQEQLNGGDAASLYLAQQLQEQDRQAAAAAASGRSRRKASSAGESSSSKSSNCVIS